LYCEETLFGRRLIIRTDNRSKIVVRFERPGEETKRVIVNADIRVDKDHYATARDAGAKIASVRRPFRLSDLGGANVTETLCRNLSLGGLIERRQRP
jgi:hypothetical protein